MGVRLKADTSAVRLFGVCGWFWEEYEPAGPSVDSPAETIRMELIDVKMQDENDAEQNKKNNKTEKGNEKNE